MLKKTQEKLKLKLKKVKKKFDKKVAAIAVCLFLCKGFRGQSRHSCRAFYDNVKYLALLHTKKKITDRHRKREI